jgi:hypothetical protein
MPKLVLLAEKLHASVRDLKPTNPQATLDGDDFRTQASFVPFVERLVTMMAPIVREISDRSLMPSELILRRLVSDDRREEIFVTRASLIEKYSGLTEPLRAHFVPLALETPSGRRYSQTPPLEPETVVEVRSELPPSVPPPPPFIAPPPVSLPKPPPLPPASSRFARGPSSQKPVPVAADVTPSAPQIEAVAPPQTEAVAPPPPSLRSEGKNEVLVATLKKIVGLAKRGNGDEAYREYFALFSNEAFAGYRPEDQRQALKLMVMSKAPPSSTEEAVTQAHRAAIERLKVLVEKFAEPGDHELLGISQIAVDERSEASDTFKKGLAIERERGPQSELCGTLMRRISEL